MHIVQFGARRKAVLFAEMLDQFLLRQAQIRGGADHGGLCLQEPLRPLCFQQLLIGGFRPQRQRGLGVEGFRVRPCPGCHLFGEAASRLQPGLEHDGVVVQTAAAQRHPRLQDAGIAPFGLPQVGEPRPLRHAAQHLIHFARAGDPASRIDHLAERCFDDSVAAGQCRDGRGKLAANRCGGGPKVHDGLAGPREIGRDGGQIGGHGRQRRRLS